MKTGAELIAEERQRQINEKGWTAEHDDSHTRGELSDVGALLAIDISTYSDIAVPPWGAKLDDHVREKYADHPVRRLTIAGALIAAEIDRLQRTCAGFAQESHSSTEAQ